MLFGYYLSFLFLLDDCLFLDLSLFFTSTLLVSTIGILTGVFSTFGYFLSSYFSDTPLFNTGFDGLGVSAGYSTFAFKTLFGSTFAFSDFFGKGVSFD